MQKRKEGARDLCWKLFEQKYGFYFIASFISKPFGQNTKLAKSKLPFGVGDVWLSLREEVKHSGEHIFFCILLPQVQFPAFPNFFSVTFRIRNKVELSVAHFKHFCSTSLPLATTGWIQSTIKVCTIHLPQAMRCRLIQQFQVFLLILNIGWHQIDIRHKDE